MMQETTEPVRDAEVREELKSFMNEPDAPVPEEPKAPAPMMMDDFTPVEGVKDFRLTTEQIAEAGYLALVNLDYQFTKPGDFIAHAWSELPPEQKLHYIGMVNFFMNSAANPNGHESCQALHDLVIDAKLRDGWCFGDTYSEMEKTDPTLLPYKTLPQHVKARNFLFRCVCVGLIAIWKGH